MDCVVGTALLAPRTASSVAPVCHRYGRSLRPCLGTSIAPRRRATFHQTLLAELLPELDPVAVRIADVEQTDFAVQLEYDADLDSLLA
jgi:hypothetical protein